MKRWTVIGVIVLCLLIIWGLSWHEDRWTGSTMGTTYSVHIFRPGFLQLNNDVPSLKTLKQQVEKDLQNVNQSMSTYIADSEISEFNRLKPGEVCQPVSKDFHQVLQVAGKIYKETNGYFDATVGPLVDLWGFGGKSQLSLNWQPPSATAIQKVLQNVGFDHLILNSADKCVVKKAPVEVDLSAVAKGYGVDILATRLKAEGIDNFLVEIGGEVYVSGEKQALRPWLETGHWHILIETPAKNLDSSRPASAPAMSAELRQILAHPLELKNTAVATSGDYHNYYEYEGQFFSHIISPLTGHPLDYVVGQPRLTSVTVLASTTAVADGYATGLFVLGVEKAKKLAISQQLQVVLVYEDRADGKLQVWMSPEFQSSIDFAG